METCYCRNFQKHSLVGSVNAAPSHVCFRIPEPERTVVEAFVHQLSLVLEAWSLPSVASGTLRFFEQMSWLELHSKYKVHKGPGVPKCCIDYPVLNLHELNTL